MKVKELLVVSGKGGTGKTSIVGSFAVLAKDKVLADCDVDAADLHLLLKPHIRQTNEFYGSKKPVIDYRKCNGCGICAESCRFEAIDKINASSDRKVKIDHITCEGCGVCFWACPKDAITLKDHLSGYWFISDTSFGPLVHARLTPGEENSGKLVTQVRREAQLIAKGQGLSYIITDGPPGIGCPVIASISGIDLALIITEPTVAGIHDFKRLLELIRHFKVKTLVCINKYDLDEKKSKEMEYYCRSEGIDLVGKIPFDEEVVKALAKGMPPLAPTGHIFEHSRHNEGKASKAIRELWTKVLTYLE